jgi:hypothetical protein
MDRPERRAFVRIERPEELRLIEAVVVCNLGSAIHTVHVNASTVVEQPVLYDRGGRSWRIEVAVQERVGHRHRSWPYRINDLVVRDCRGRREGASGAINAI